MTSGYFDGSGVSMLSGESWKALMETVLGYQPLGLEKITFVGVRDLSYGQFEKLERSSARVVYGESKATTNKKRTNFAAGLDEVLNQVPEADARQCLVHVDLDCLDTSVGRVNEYAAPGGLHEEDLLNCLDVVVTKRRPIALTIASFNPYLGGGDTVAEIAVKAILNIISKL